MNTNQNNPPPGTGADAGAAFAQMWAESCSKILQAAMTFSPDSVPPEILRQIRGGILQSLTQSWDAFLRSPQFMQGMQQLFDNALSFRKFAGDVFTKARQETQGLAQEDLDGLRGEIRQSEDRFLAALEDLGSKLAAIETRLAGRGDRARPGAGRGPKKPSNQDSRRAGRGKVKRKRERK